MNRFALLAVALVLAGCGPASNTANEPPLAGAKIGGPFTLTDQDGKTVRDTDFNGKYRIVYFGFTYCPDICPTALQKIGGAMKALDKSDPAVAGKVVPIFITIDPERDTPAVMKQYVANFYPRMVGLTGTLPQIEAGAKQFAVYREKVQPKGASEYTMNHSDVTYLFGPDGKPVALLPTDQSTDAVAAEIKRWVR